MQTLYNELYTERLSFSQSMILVQADPMARIRLLLTKDRQRAHTLCKKYACQQHPAAQNFLGILYGEQKNFTKALFWLEKAAACLPSAVCNLAKVKLMMLEQTVLTATERQSLVVEVCEHLRHIQAEHPEARCLWQRLKAQRAAYQQQPPEIKPLEFEFVPLTTLLKVPTTLLQRVAEEEDSLAARGYETSDNYQPLPTSRV